MQVLVHASSAVLELRMRGSSQSSIEIVRADRCLVRLCGRSVDEIALWPGVLATDFEVVDSPELAVAVERIAQRYAGATSSAPDALPEDPTRTPAPSAKQPTQATGRFAAAPPQFRGRQRTHGRERAARRAGRTAVARTATSTELEGDPL